MRAFILKLLFRLSTTLSLPAVHAIGGAIGWLFAVIPNKRRRTARINLQLCFPSMTQRARTRLARDSLIEFGKTLTETAVLWTCTTEELGGLIQKVLGEELVKNARRQKKGLILAMPHLGAW